MNPSSRASHRLVSILVANFNGASLLKNCLRSLQQIQYPNYEVIVVDNASVDESIDVLKSFPSVKVVRSSRNLGFAGGNNLGLPMCSGDYILLLNNDTTVPPDFLQPLCDYLDSHPNVGVVQGKLVLPRYEGRLDVCGSFLTWLGLPYHYGYYKPDGPRYRLSYPVFSGKGACLMFRRDLISKVGGFLFDESFFCYYEESDFCHRTWLAGFEVHFVPSPPIQHYMGATSGDSQSVFVLRHYLRNMTFSLASNLSFFSRLRILPVFLGVMWISMAAALLKAKGQRALAHVDALSCLLQDRAAIRARRKLVSGFRRVSDAQIFSKTLVNPRLSYFAKTFSGKIAEYEDEPIFS